MSRKRKEDILTGFYVALIIVAMFVAVIVVRWVILTKVPCSLFTLAEAPVRCVK